MISIELEGEIDRGASMNYVTVVNDASKCGFYIAKDCSHARLINMLNETLAIVQNKANR